MKDERIDRAIRNILAGQKDRDAGACPSDSRIAAYLDARLRPDECAEFEAHVSSCASCREILSLSLQLGEEPQVTRQTLPAQEKKVIFHFAIPMSALALVVVASLAGVLYYRAVRNAGKSVIVTQTAEVREADKSIDRAEPSQEFRTAGPEKRREVAATDSSKAISTRPITTVPARSAARDTAASPPPPAVEDEKIALGNEAETEAPIASKASAARSAIELPAGKKEVPGAAAPAEPPMVVGGIRPPVRAASEEGAAGVAAEARMQMAVADQPSKGKPAQARLGRIPADTLAMAMKPEDAARDAIAQLSKYVKDKAKSDSAGEKKIGDRIFVLISGFWIDRTCTARADAQLVETQSGSATYEAIRKAVVGFDELLAAGESALIFWDGKIYLIRP